jgi:hypothetical protein
MWPNFPWRHLVASTCGSCAENGWDSKHGVPTRIESHLDTSEGQQTTFSICMTTYTTYPIIIYLTGGVSDSAPQGLVVNGPGPPRGLAVNGF